MKVVDVNVLLYAVNADTPHHEPSRRWLHAPGARVLEPTVSTSRSSSLSCRKFAALRWHRPVDLLA